MSPVLDNKVAIIDAIDRFQKTLSQLRDEVKAGDANALLDRFSRCRQVRVRIGREESE